MTLRRLPKTIVVIACLVVSCAGAPAVGSPRWTVRDVGPMVGFRRHESSYTVAVADVDHDGWPDVLIGHHGSRPAELFMNQPDGEGGTLGFEPVFRLVDTIHARPDRHGCIMGDPNLDGLTDILCLKGAQQGTAKKWNELWIQGPKGVWADEAHAWGIEDVWGRGRHPAWIDLNGDRYPDLFIGNDEPRHDGHITPNRTFVNVKGKRFREVDLGITREDGSACVQTLDVNGDGRDDLLLCGDAQTLLYVRRGSGFVAANGAYGVPSYPIANGAEIVDLSGDGIDDLVLVHLDRLEIRLGGSDGSFGPPVLEHPLAHGHGLAIGDVNGDGAPDVYAVDGCEDRVNAPDVLLLNGDDGRSWTQLALPPLPPGELAGCGDTAAMVDLDRDGMQDIVVLNGGGNDQPLDLDGPDQLLTLGSWRPQG
ncbi:MAG: VCBS repeat-containing protein [Actinomycetota bacterium]|nr:VCBS repeat-containing protein [Actinomycetota bacterium]